MDPELTHLLGRAREGDAAAMGEVAEEFRDTVLRSARSMLADAHEAEDAAQDALVLAFERLPTLRDLEAFPGWLQLVVRTAVGRRVRRRRPDLLEPADLEGRGEGEDADPGEGLVKAEVRAAVRDAIRGLSPRLAAVIERHYLEGLPVAEIAARLGLPEGTVKRRLHDARERLRPGLLGLARRPDTHDGDERRPT